MKSPPLIRSPLAGEVLILLYAGETGAASEWAAALADQLREVHARVEFASDPEAVARVTQRAEGSVLVLLAGEAADVATVGDLARRTVAPLVVLHEDEPPADRLLAAGAASLLPVASLVRGEQAFRACLAQTLENWRQRGAQPSRCFSESLHRFVRDALHELRTSLSAVHGFASLLSDGLAGEMSAKQCEYVAYMQGGADSLLHELEEFHDAFRLRLGLWSTCREQVELAPLLRAPAPPPGLVARVTLELPALDGVRVEADADQLTRALGLILAHALERAEGATLRVEADLADPLEVALEVPLGGSPPCGEDARLLRDGVVQDANGTRTVTRVLGLRLALARSLVCLAGGELAWLPSPQELGPRSRLVVRLPRARASSG